MKSDSTVSIIMPTLNSEKTIELALRSIRNQIYDQSQIEILVIDGGSTDNTQQIALQYKAKIIPNPLVQPECAKHIGLLRANSAYAIFLDSDEVFSSDSSIHRRIYCLKTNSLKMVLTGGYKKPDNYSSINDFINTFSDPFSFFMYGISADSRYYLKHLIRKYKVEEQHTDYAVLFFEKKDMLPLVDVCAGNTIDLRYVKKAYNHMIQNISIIPQLFSLIATDSHKIAVLKDDYIIHYSSDSYKKYLRKITWRVIINIHYIDKVGVGFSNREQFQPLLFKLKKYIFIPYALTFILPFVVGIYYAISRKMIVNLLYGPLTFYTAIIIVYQYSLKLLGIKPVLNSYGS